MTMLQVRIPVGSQAEIDRLVEALRTIQEAGRAAARVPGAMTTPAAVEAAVLVGELAEWFEPGRGVVIEGADETTFWE